MTLRRRGTLSFATAAVVFAIAGAVAYACTNLATLNLSTPTGKVGDQITLTGSSFRVPTAQAGKPAAAPNPVVLQWNGANGPVLASVLPDKAGNISATFSIPDSQPGYYVIVASQRTPQGVDEYGTPARASFQVLSPGGQSVVPQAGGQTPATVTSDPSSTGIIALTVTLGALGLALFGAGFTAFVRQARRREVPATTPVRRS